MNQTNPENSSLYPELSLDSILQTIKNSRLLSAYDRDTEPPSWIMDQRKLEVAKMYENDYSLVKSLIDQDIEGLHGTRSPSLLSIITNGLVAPSRQHTLATPIIAGEHYSQLTPREGVHVVHWSDAKNTQQFAEDSTNRKNDGLSFHNYGKALEVSDEFIDMIHPTLALKTHLLNRKRKAQQLDNWLNSDAPSEIERDLLSLDFPIVTGISLDKINDSDITGAKSSIKGDCFIASDIPPNNIKSLFVPSNHMEFVSTLTTNTDIQVIALERLRKV